MPKICLVGPGHLGSNPRLVKEADTLIDAGYLVHVIYGELHEPAMERDKSILSHARWTHEKVSLLDLPRRGLLQRIRCRISKVLFRLGVRIPAVVIRAHHVLGPEIISSASRQSADLYIGHCLAALPAVVAAAKRTGARVCFDAEDFHSGECPETGKSALFNAIAQIIEREFLPECDYVTAASPLIAEAYKATYGISVVPILNVFPLSESVDQVSAPVDPTFYWFSQTIGPGRGLEAVIDILSQLHKPVSLDLRGECSDVYKAQLFSRAAGSRLSLKILPPEMPNKMVHCCSGYTAGLALELTSPRNRDLCLTNKAFTYLLAGVPVIFSHTLAQDRLAQELAEAAIQIDLNNIESSAKILSGWLSDDRAQPRSRSAAFDLGRTRYNWDIEKQLFLKGVAALLNSH